MEGEQKLAPLPEPKRIETLNIKFPFKTLADLCKCAAPHKCLQWNGVAITYAWLLWGMHWWVTDSNGTQCDMRASHCTNFDKKHNSLDGIRAGNLPTTICLGTSEFIANSRTYRQAMREMVSSKFLIFNESSMHINWKLLKI